MRRVLLTLVAVLVAASGTACSPPPSGGGILTVPSPADPTATTASPTPTVAATCDQRRFTSNAVTVIHSVPSSPLPAVTAIRPGSHPECGFDRVTFDFTGPVPGYTVMSVNVVVRDGSGAPVRVPGAAYLLIRFDPATTVSLSTAPVPVGYPILRGYVVSGDFEGIVSVALGLSAPAKVRVGELPGGRVYVDLSR
jgi:hypothetical protein